jgi:uncharacterized membrane protein
MNHVNTATHCRCSHHKIVPVLVVLLGLLFLLANLGVFSGSFTGVAWPILLILIGLVKLNSGSCKCYMQAS